jgi:hypothetical protein
VCSRGTGSGPRRQKQLMRCVDGWAAVDSARRGGSKIVLLTSLGGGAFGNHEDWILGAMRRGFGMVAGFDLDVRLVSYGEPSRGLVQLAEELG